MHIVLPLCLDPPLFPKFNFKRMTMLECPWHDQPLWIGQFDFLWNGNTLVIHMVPSPSMSSRMETHVLCPNVGTL